MAKTVQPKAVRLSVLTATAKANEETIIDLPQGGYINRVAVTYTSSLTYEAALVMDGKRKDTYARSISSRTPYNESTNLANHLPLGGRMRDYSTQYLNLYRESLGYDPKLYWRANRDVRMTFEIWDLGGVANG